MTTSVREEMIFGLGNPLLDISANVDSEFLKHYELKENDQILANEKHSDLFEKMIEKFEVSYIPGGATQNAIRVAQWMLGIKHSTSFTGCIGKDRFGEILEKIIDKEGVQPLYRYSEQEKTGTCAVCITEEKHLRSLVAYLGAANHFCREHIDSEKVWKVVEKAQVIYTAGFVLTACPEAMLRLAQYACNTPKIFALNLSAPFLSKFFKEPLTNLIPYTDYLFGNETEFETFAEENGIESKDLKEIALAVSNLPKADCNKPRTVVLTHGSQPTIVATGGQVREFPVLKIDKEDIVDSNGAGDAFVGGFLSCLARNCTLEECVAGGNYAANYVLKQSGVQLPTPSTFQWV
ncbi:hypothetical protein HELRODRAFT_193631 [Helobdella robusta]|uniref:Adenosine kinase n=1 Tax=Helobdella robusta TaxID=6412 RepID=T1FV76_HELRO|nr:hypothetical protein HELRODRAFT_193631 [Helobdella robusta]ESN95086.1 hypothetical protein HELRODRAFT_193631 [Helobdella robusta]